MALHKRQVVRLVGGGSFSS